MKTRGPRAAAGSKAFTQIPCKEGEDDWGGSGCGGPGGRGGQGEERGEGRGAEGGGGLKGRAGLDSPLMKGYWPG